MPNPICDKCGQEMKPIANGVYVRQIKSPLVYSGDKFQCEQCKATIICNFGKGFQSDHVDVEFTR